MMNPIKVILLLIDKRIEELKRDTKTDTVIVRAIIFELENLKRTIEEYQRS